MFTLEALLLGALAAFVVGLSKTAVPGAGLLTVPLVATVVEGRLIAGTSLPLLLVADVFAVSWYRHHTRWELLRPIAVWWPSASRPASRSSWRSARRYAPSTSPSAPPSC